MSKPDRCARIVNKSAWLFVRLVRRRLHLTGQVANSAAQRRDCAIIIQLHGNINLLMTALQILY
ncbi:hypothetical protein NS303_05170 [Pantoea ananatis]|nr:hypothetical protein NS303_05170 [Pantoea ananatis]KTR57265.1 hypothetical protein NS311_02935 [Pantoea ananatis]KTR70954.1 hypothetical protein NS296_07435 [Pantoea ananatis]